MKKFLIMVAFAGVSVTGMAQSENVEKKYSVETNSFWSNWFIQVNVGYDVFYSDQEKGKGFSKSPFKGFRSNVSPSVGIGKWFTPGIGMRTKVTGLWGRSVSSENSSDNAMKFFHAQEQVLFNLSNMLCGYNEKRVWNAIPYVGVGFLRNFDKNENCHTAMIGLWNTFRLSNRWAVNLDLSFNVSDDDIEGAKTDHSRYLTSLANSDRYFAAEVGLTYNLGKTGWKKIPDIDAIRTLHQNELDELNAKLANANAENDRLNNQLKNHKCPEPQTVTVEKVVEKVMPVKVFFSLDQAKIASRKDLVQVNELVSTYKDKNFKVTGYADSKTGKSTYNQKLSERRANTVANELVKMGVNRDNIEIVAAGGVDTWNPNNYNRCAVIEVK